MTLENQVKNDGLTTDVLTVSQLNGAVSHCLSESFGPMWVRGEVSNFTAAASGHWYFTLKDAGAAVRSVMFRSRAQSVGFVPKAGEKVEIRARVSLYEPRGDYQLQVEGMRRAGLGDLYEAFMRLKAQLSQEGVFDPERKRALPSFPRAIGVVTSRQAAALRDVLSALRRRAPQVPVIVYPAPVQGAQAAARLAEAVRTANARAEVDVLLVVRGGGSIEDLWSFNEAVLAYAIAESAIPVISGVGHETDFTIADFAADVRAPTPTAAAELACVSTEALQRRWASAARGLREAFRWRADRWAQQVDYAASRLVPPFERVRQQHRDLAAIKRRLMLTVPHALAALRARHVRLHDALARSRPDVLHATRQLDEYRRRLGVGLRQAHLRRNQQWAVLAARLAAQDPSQPLSRGFALVLDDTGQIVRDAERLRPKQRLTLKLERGAAQVSVMQLGPSAPGSASDAPGVGRQGELPT